MIYGLAFILGLVLLGFEIVQFRVFDTLLTRTFVLILPLFMFGTSVGHAAAYLRRQTRAREILPWSLGLLLVFLTLNLAGYSYFKDWRAQMGFGAVTAFGLTLLWGLSVVMLYREGRPLRVNAWLALGGAAGAGFVPLMDAFGYMTAVRVLLLAGTLGAGAFWIREGSRWRVAGIPLLLFQLTFSFASPDPDPQSPALAAFSNSYSNLKIVDGIHPFPSLTPQAGERTEFDGDLRVFSIFRNRVEASLIVDPLHGDDLQVMKLESAHTLYGLGPKGHLAVVGSGGGAEILHGQLQGFQRITAIEVNPLMVQAAKAFTRNPKFGYQGTEVETHISEGRVFFRRLAPSERFDMISLTSTRSYGHLGTSVFAENYLLTREAFAEYVDHLNPGGILLVRVTQGFSLIGSLRQSLSRAVEDGEIYQLLLDQKISGSFRQAKEAILVYKKGRFTPGQLQIFKDLTDIHRPVRVLGRSEKKPGAAVITDDRPFTNLMSKVELEHGLPTGALPLSMLVIQLILLAGLWVWEKKKLAPPRPAETVYAFLSGWGFAGLQGLLLDRVTFLTGEPASSLAAVLALFFAGGALASLWLDRDGRRLHIKSLPVVLAALALASVFVHQGMMWAATLPLGPAATHLTGLAGVALVSVLAGLAFSLFFKEVCAQRPQAIPLVLCANGLGALFAAVQLKLVAIELGFSLAVLVTAAVYLLMAVLPIGARRSV